MSTPTPKKKGRKSKTPIPGDDRVASSREKFIKEHRPQGRLPSFDGTKAAIEELLKENREILGRLKGYTGYDWEEGVGEGKKMASSASLNRQAYEVVKTRHENGCILFVTYPRYRETPFDITSLIEVPPELSIIYPLRHQSGLIDYESFLERSFLLNDDVLVPFMCNLKEHLATVQKSLVDMEEWLATGQCNKSFIETTFGAGCIDEAKECSDDNRICANCGCPYNTHDVKRYSYNSGDHADCLGKGGKRYKQSQAILLKEFDTASKVVDTFDISDEKEQKRLLKLMDYLAVN